MNDGEEIEAVNETQFVDFLMDTFYENFYKQFRDVRSFADAGLLTSNSGLVVTLNNGTTFQITVVRSN